MSRYSGKLQFRTDARVHAKLAAQAKKHGLSINRFLNQLVQKGLERQMAKGDGFIQWLNSLKVTFKPNHFSREDAYTD